MTPQEQFDWLNRIWRKAAEGDQQALTELLVFISVKGRDQLAQHFRYASNVRSGKTTQILTLASEKVWLKAKKGTLEWPKVSAYKLLVAYLKNCRKEVERNNKPQGDSIDQIQQDVDEGNPINREELEKALTQKREPDPAEDADLVLLKQQLECLQGSLAGFSERDAEIIAGKMADLSDKELAAKVGMSYEALRQRLHRLRPAIRKFLEENSAA